MGDKDLVSELPQIDRPARLLSIEQAARYVGVSRVTFKSEVGRGIWPQPVRRGERHGRVTWDVRALDLACDRLSGLDRSAGETPQGQDTAEAAVIRRIRGR